MGRPVLTDEEVEAFRRRACDAAMTLFGELGYDQFSLRALAREMGCSHATPYRYFDGKDAIFAEVGAEGFRRFAAFLTARLEASSKARERLRILARAYFDFAQEQPAAFRIIFELGQPTAEDYPVVNEAAGAAWGVLVGVVKEAIDAGVLAGLIGVLLVSIYLIAYYRYLGVVAILSLLISGALLWTIVAWLGASQGLALTLAGVTGLIVSIGVSVDSNVVYFEHLKEDVKGGRTVRSAVERSFPIAYSTIVKANVASLIAAVVLYTLTVGQVRGFALFLGLATVLDLVATYFFMGPAIRILANLDIDLARKPSTFGIPKALDATPEPATTGGAS